MNQPWFEPREIDWQDGLNPLAIPSYKQHRNPFVYRALQNPTMYELRQARGMELRLYAAPDEAYPTLPGGFTYDSIISLRMSSWLIGISGSSDRPEGYLAQITLPTGGTLFSRPVRSADLDARPLYFSTPCGLPAGGSIRMRMINQAAVANMAHFVLWVIQPI